MRLPILSLLLFAVLAAPAAADSIVYAKDANIWAARPDGSGAVQITKDGTAANRYGEATQADDGAVLAVQGNRFHRFDRSGNRVATFGSVLTDKPNQINAYGPWDSRISPDGQKVAYWLGIIGGWYDYSTGIYYRDPQSAVVYQSAVNGAQLGNTMFYEEPSWLADSKHLLIWDSINGGVPQVATGEIGADHNHFTGWFHDLDTFADPEGWKPIGAGEVSRDGKRLALLRAPATMGNGGLARGLHNSLVFYEVSGFDHAPAPMACVFVDDDGSEMGPPSWSPDGRSVAWATAKGVWVGTIGDPRSCNGWDMKLVIPGGLEPDWGPADPGPGSVTSNPQPPKGSDPGKQLTPGKEALKLTVAASIRRAALLRRGLPVSVSCASGCKIDAVARSGARKVGEAHARRRAAGRARLVVRVSRKVRRGTLKLSVAVRPRGGAAQTLKRSVRVR
jgi:hypothetical protein